MYNESMIGNRTAVGFIILGTMGIGTTGTDERGTQALYSLPVE